MSTTENSKMVSLSYKYTITYTNGWERNLGDYQSMIANIQEEDYLKIVKGVADGLELMEIEDIDSVLEEMKQNVIWDDSWYNTNGTRRNSQLKKPREYQKIEMFLDQKTVKHIRSMKNPMEEMSRPEQNMTVYRSDGSHVTLSYKNGTIKYTDSRKQGSVFSMTADTFLNWFVH